MHNTRDSSQNHATNTQAKKEVELLAAIRGLSRREAQNPAEAQARVRTLIGELEAAKGIPKPARAPQVRYFSMLCVRLGLYRQGAGTPDPTHPPQKTPSP